MSARAKTSRKVALDMPSTGPDPKRRKLELCPHKEGCYRRNPHHFREFDHPHLLEFIQDESKITESLPQPKQVYLEQLAILKTLTPDNVIGTLNATSGPGAGAGAGATNSSSSALTDGKDSGDQKINNTVPSTSKVRDVSVCEASAASLEKGATNSTSTVSSTLEKLKITHPYNLFFTEIPKSTSTLNKPNTVKFTDLLCPSLGDLKRSLQMNFMIDVMWLMEQYKKRDLHKKPITVVYGSDEFPQMEEYMDRFMPNVTYHRVKMKDPFGTHHSKIGLYRYEDDSLRVVVSTANLYYEDWNHYNQGLWISPRCPKLPDGPSSSKGESRTGFKSSLKKYLQTYSLSCLNDWIKYVEEADFTDIRVALVTSTPGKHYPGDEGSHLHRVASLLTRHCSLPPKTTPSSEGPLSWGVVAQASTIGTLGKSAGDWLRSCLLRSLAAHQGSSLSSSPAASLSVVFPTVKNVVGGYFGAESGGCLPYSKHVNEKQRWLQDYLCQWKAEGLERTRAMPHIKSYCRISPDLTKLAWFLLTSSNISKAAWGANIQKDSGNYVRSYEAGVMFLPKFFDEEFFEMGDTSNGKDKAVFPFMYDLPLTPYKADDFPYCR